MDAPPKQFSTTHDLRFPFSSLSSTAAEGIVTDMGGGDDMPISSGIMEETLVDDVISSDSSSSCFSHCSSSDAQVAKSHCLLRMDEAPELGEVVNSKPREEALMEETKSYGVFKNVKKKTKEPENKKDGIPEKKKSSRYLDVIDYHEKSSQRTSTVNLLQEAKSVIMSYKPGQWIEPAGHIPPSEYDVPSTTTLLLIGPRGSGKSSIVNSITRTFQDDDLIPDRAQVSYNLSSEGTCFLQEYMIPRHSKAFCIYDSRSLSENTSDNFKLLKTWMTRGVRHREMVLRDSDSFSTKERIKSKVRHGCFAPSKKRRVDFAIFVVDGILVLKSMRSEDKQYTDILVEAFNYPFMSFGDHKPAVVVTHGDQLSFSERAEVCTHLGEILGIPPVKQIFDITADTTSPATELAIAELLRFALEQADRNLPCKQSLLLMTENILQRVMDEAEHSTTWTATLEFFFIGFIILLLLHLFLG